LIKDQPQTIHHPPLSAAADVISCTCAELQQPNPGEDRKQLVGGVFDLDLHPSISRYNNSAELSYRPLKFVPVQNARISVQ
jgi:hypothetical protein